MPKYRSKGVKSKSKRLKSKRVKSKRVKSKRVKSKHLRGGSGFLRKIKNFFTQSNVDKWKQKSLIPYLKNVEDSFELFIRRYEGKLQIECGLTREQYEELLAVAIKFDASVPETDNLISSVDKFTDELIRICGVKTIDCLGI